MGIPTADEMSDNPLGPPIRVCSRCQSEGDEVLADLTVRTRSARWLTCHRCGRRSKLGSLVRRCVTDQP